MKRILFVIALLVCWVSGIQAQQRPQFSQYMLNQYLFNPALTGIEDYTDVRMGTRYQWVGLDGAPVTYYVSAHTPLNKEATSVKNRYNNKTHSVNRNRFYKARPHHGVGVMANVDKTGVLRRTNLTGSYAFHLPVSHSINVSVGLSAGMIRNSLNTSEATYINPADPAINADFVNKTYLDLNLGTWIYSQDFFVGFAGAQLARGRTDLNNSPNQKTPGVIQRHFYATAGYKFRFGNDLALIPSVMMKMAGPSPFSVDANLRAIYADRVWAGVSYRNQESFAGLVGLNISYLMDIGYSYDYNNSELSITNTGSHEIVLGLKLFNKGRVICPQWMQ